MITIQYNITGAFLFIVLPGSDECTLNADCVDDSHLVFPKYQCHPFHRLHHQHDDHGHHDDQQGSLPSCSSTTFCHLSSWRRPTASTTSTSSTTSEQSYGLLMMILILVSDDDDKCDNDDNDGENDNVNANHQVRRCRHHCQLPPHRNHPCLDTGFHNSIYSFGFNNFTTFIWSWWRFSQFYIQFFLWCDIFGLGSTYRFQKAIYSSFDFDTFGLGPQFV